MTSINQAFLVTLSMFLCLSYSSEAQLAPAPAIGGIGGEISINKQNLVADLTGVIPKGEEYLKLINARIEDATRPLPSSSGQCLSLCLATYEKEIEDLKKFVQVLSSSTTPEIDFDTTIEKAELDGCDACLRDVAKDDPEFNNYTQWFYSTTAKVGELINKYNS